MLALVMLIWTQKQPVGQQITVEIPLKYTKVANIDVWLATSWHFNGNLAWTPDYARNALRVSGTEKEIADFKSAIEYQDKAPSPMEFVIRRIRVARETKDRLDLSIMRTRSFPGNAGLTEHVWKYTSLSAGDLFDQ